MYTYGNEFETLDGKPYSGDYHIIKGLYYTGKIHVFKVSKQIKPIQKNDQYYQYGIKYKDLNQQLSINIRDFIIESDTENLTYYILKNNIDGNIYRVKKESYDKYGHNRFIKKAKIKLKKNTGFLEYTYNNNQIKKIQDKEIREFIENII